MSANYRVFLRKVEAVRLLLRDTSWAIDQLGDAWAQDPENRNRPERQGLMLELADAVRILQAADVLDRIEDVLATRPEPSWHAPER